MRAKPQTTTDTSLLCSEPGCTEVWSSNYGRRYCSAHNPGLNGHQPVKRQARLDLAIPLRDAVRPFSEPAERDGDAA